MTLRDEILTAIADKPRSPSELAAITGVSVDRVAVCLGALDRDGRVTLTAQGWIACKRIKRNRARRREYEFVNGHLRCYSDGQKLYVCAYVNSRKMWAEYDPADLLAITAYANDVGLLEAAA